MLFMDLNEPRRLELESRILHLCGKAMHFIRKLERKPFKYNL